MDSEIKALIFDMDGVLLDSEAVYEKVWRIAADKMGVTGIDAVHKNCLGRNKTDSCAILRTAYGKEFAAEEFWALTDELSLKEQEESGVPLKPFAKETLSYLKQKGYDLALASSTERSVVERELSKAGLLNFFSKLVCGDEVEKSKPNPQIYLLALQKLALDAENCVAVEDSPAGIESAYAANLKCVMIPDRVTPDGQTKKLLWKLCTSLSDLRLFL